MNIQDLIRGSILEPSDAKRFDELRHQAFTKAQAIWMDRAKSYNLDSSPTDEMPYGVLSGVSEVYKRVKRLKSLVTPLRTASFRDIELERMLDTCTDMINYGSWLYALFQIATENMGVERQSEMAVRGPDADEQEQMRIEAQR